MNTRVVGRSATRGAVQLNYTTLHQLIDGEIAYIRLQDCLDEEKARATCFDDVAKMVQVNGLADTGVIKYPLRVDLHDGDTAAANGSTFAGCDSILQRPLQLLLRNLDGAWPWGVKSSSGSPNGVYRYFAGGGHFGIHIDRAVDGWGCGVARLAVVGCLIAATAGGEGNLEMWDLVLPESEFDAIRELPYEMQRRILGQPALSLIPEAGDLIVFNSEQLHAVTPTISTRRLTISCFAGINGPGEALHIGA